MTNSQLKQDLENFSTKSSKKIYIILLVFFVAIGLFTYYFIFNNNNKTKTIKPKA